MKDKKNIIKEIENEITELENRINKDDKKVKYNLTDDGTGKKYDSGKPMVGTFSLPGVAGSVAIT